VVYYEHRHSGTDENNILQEIIAVKGETAPSFPLIPQCGIHEFRHRGIKKRDGGRGDVVKYSSDTQREPFSIDSLGGVGLTYCLL
jgi:hypothetical protein